jgi:hypothetical protein
VPDAGKQIDELRKETTEQSRILERVETTVLKISEALIGTLKEQGLISQISDLKKEINELNIWRSGIENFKNALVMKIVVIGGIAVLLVFGAAWAIVKSTAGM